jgi:hypothetical protein
MNRLTALVGETGNDKNEMRGFFASLRMTTEKKGDCGGCFQSRDATLCRVCLASLADRGWRRVGWSGRGLRGRLCCRRCRVR